MASTPAEPSACHARDGPTLGQPRLAAQAAVSKPLHTCCSSGTGYSEQQRLLCLALAACEARTGCSSSGRTTWLALRWLMIALADDQISQRLLALKGPHESDQCGLHTGAANGQIMQFKSLCHQGRAHRLEAAWQVAALAPAPRAWKLHQSLLESH